MLCAFSAKKEKNIGISTELFEKEKKGMFWF